MLLCYLQAFLVREKFGNEVVNVNLKKKKRKTSLSKIFLNLIPKCDYVRKKEENIKQMEKSR